MNNVERTYHVDKNHLLGILEKNRDKHKETFKKAMAEYKKKAKTELCKRLALIEINKKFTLTFSLPEPVNYTKEYDSIIGLLKISTDTILLITHSEYRQWVEDQWSWNHNFFVNTSSYIGASSVDDDTEEEVKS